MTATEDTEPASNYHKTTTDLRRELVAASARWNQDAKKYGDIVHAAFAVKRGGGTPEEVPESVRDAYAASLMALSYSYTLAAILGVTEREFGPEVAKRLTFEASEILVNGDFDNLNADVQET